MRTLWLLHELGVPFDTLFYRFGLALQAPEYRAINPVGRVPALEIDGLVLTESGAITQLLTERFSESGLGRAPGSLERAAYLQWVHFAETLSTHAQILSQQHIFLREDYMRSPTLTKLEPRRIARCYDAIEEALSTEHLLSSFSAADISVGQAVWLGRHFARLDGHPRTAAWMARLEARPAFAKALPAPGETGLYDRDFYDPIPEAK